MLVSIDIESTHRILDDIGQNISYGIVLFLFYLILFKIISLIGHHNIAVRKPRNLILKSRMQRIGGSLP